MQLLLVDEVEQIVRGTLLLVDGVGPVLEEIAGIEVEGLLGILGDPIVGAVVELIEVELGEAQL